MSLRILIALLDILDCTMDDLLETAGPRRPGPSATCSSSAARPALRRSHRRSVPSAASNSEPSSARARTGVARSAGRRPPSALPVATFDASAFETAGACRAVRCVRTTTTVIHIGLSTK
ncbi:hypothetical protein [Streptomyces gossypii]|uniref:hypothetical protein n=1 Tax=Streptomyces gossypii TaxID=2883101 RepID=UPI0035CCE787